MNAFKRTLKVMLVIQKDLIFIVAAGIVSAAVAAPSQPAKGDPATFIEPTDIPHKHCAGSCISRGAVQWYCKPDQTCSINCSTAPPNMQCLGGSD